MLRNELVELESAIDDINSGLERVYRTLNDILSHPAKNYDLTFKNEVFNLMPPLTMQDELSMQQKRRRYIKLILKYVLKRRIGDLRGDPDHYPKEMFEIWFALAYGQDPKYHQIKKIVLDEIHEAQDERDDKYGKKRPLDEDAYQVKNERLTSERLKE